MAASSCALVALSPPAARASEAEQHRRRRSALRPGQSVADVGAGEGDFTIALGRAVGPAGRVFATEVESDKLEKIQETVERRRLANVTVLRGEQAATGLPDGCCDAILLRIVYHHFTDPRRCGAACGPRSSPAAAARGRDAAAEERGA